MQTKLVTAKFATVAQAVTFVARLAEGRDRAGQVARKGRTVTFIHGVRATDWEGNPDSGFESRTSMRELVAYYGGKSTVFAATPESTRPVFASEAQHPADCVGCALGYDH